MKSLFKTTLAASALTFAATISAQANGCPSNSVWNGYNCVVPPGGGEAGSTNTNTNTAHGGAGVGIGVAGAVSGATSDATATGGNATATGGNGGSAIATGLGGQGGAGGQGGNATGGSVGNVTSGSTSSVTGSGNSSVRGSGNSRNRNSASNVNNIDASTRIRHSASGAYSANVNGCGPAGGFSAGIQTYGWGATAARCKPFLFEQVLIAEDRAVHEGKLAGAIYLSRKEQAAKDTFMKTGIITQTQIATHSGAPEPINGGHHGASRSGSTPLVIRQRTTVTVERQPVRQVLRCPASHPVMSHDRNGNPRCGR